MTEAPYWQAEYQAMTLEQLRETYRAIKVQAHLIPHAAEKMKFIESLGKVKK